MNAHDTLNTAVGPDVELKGPRHQVLDQCVMIQNEKQQPLLLSVHRAGQKTVYLPGKPGPNQVIQPINNAFFFF